jgi:hypothetical protein
MVFPAAAIPLTAACKLTKFGTGGCCANMMGQNVILKRVAIGLWWSWQWRKGLWKTLGEKRDY